MSAVLNELPAWLTWIILGVILIVAEGVVPSFFIIFFGIAGVLVGLLLLLANPSVYAQVIVWLVLSVVLLLLFRRRFSPQAGVVPVGTSTGDVVGQIGILIAPVEPSTRGKVRFTKPVLGSEEWPCVADEPIGEGVRVQVVAVEGQIVKVTKC
ncbi:MAG: NfeD family protein [Candidatus Sumerlaeaceae bacterium]